MFDFIMKDNFYSRAFSPIVLYFVLCYTVTKTSGWYTYSDRFSSLFAMNIYALIIILMFENFKYKSSIIFVILVIIHAWVQPTYGFVMEIIDFFSIFNENEEITVDVNGIVTGLEIVTWLYITLFLGYNILFSYVHHSQKEQ